MRILLLLGLWMCCVPLIAQHWVVKKDLQPEWLVSNGTAFTPFSDEVSANTVYINLPLSPFRTDYFSFTSTAPVSLFINQALVADGIHSAVLSLDSLNKIYAGERFFVALHSSRVLDPQNLTTQIKSSVLHSTNSGEEAYLKARTTFRDFALTALLVLIVFLVSIIRINPGLSSDYFSIRKIFSRRESEADHYYYRVTSGTILFYVFTSLMLSFYFMIVSRFTDAIPGMEDLQAASYGVLIFTWLKVTVYVLLFLLAKIILIYFISSLFGIREIAGYHFFNFVRILLVSIGLFSIIVLIYFIPYGQRTGFYQFLYAAIPWILGMWILLGFLKLGSRVSHSAFHLFSYICATEVIPFFLIIAVFN